jgi:DNA (cytosine-5)-methyltransferase 1|uniref:DNA (cytosine-5-)-methyltransferase n=1 Tax=viral metagenome TaxID=1070528 RepID=A0A6C0J5X2_9ZZZZ
MNSISLFSGMGGDTLGMKQAGINVKGFNEINTKFIETHNKNFENCKFIGEKTTDIMKIPDEEIKKIKDINLIFAGFPCQGFSNAGKKLPSDPRNTLFKEFVRFTTILKPDYIIGENVKGLVSRKTDKEENFIDIIVKEFKDLGYDIKYQVFKTNEYGVPQKRERLIIIGAKSSLNNPLNFPPPFESDTSLKNIIEFSMEGTIPFDFLDMGIPEECIVSNMDNDEESRNPHPYLTSKVDATLEKRTYKEKTYETLISFAKRDSPIHCEIIDIRNPSKTIICSYDHQPRLFVPIRNKKGTFIRSLLPLELKQIQGFPKNFEVLGNLKQQIVQIGNAVPPPLVKQIVEHLVL